MTKDDPRLANLKPWKPGQSGNPSGKPKNPVKPSEVLAMMGEFWSMERSELEAIARDPTETMGRSWVASLMVEGQKTGDYSRLNFFLDRTIGKVKDHIEVSTKPIKTLLDHEGNPKMILGQTPSDEEPE